MRKEGLKKDGVKNGVAEEQDADGSMENTDEHLDSSNGGDGTEPDALDGADLVSNNDTASIASEKRSKTKGAKKAIHDASAVLKTEETNGGSDSEDGGYEVDSIIDHKIERKKMLFLVRWKNYSSAEDTWEPESQLSCPDIIAAYRDEHPEAVLVVTKGTKRKASTTDKKRSASPEKKTAKQDSEVYEVEAIVDHKIERKRNVFLIRWKGYEADQDTWEKEAELTCPEILNKYKETHAGKLAEDVKTKTKKTPEEKKAAKKARADKEYEVQRIVGSKTQKGKIFYLVHWKGYSVGEQTWEAETSLNCPEKIAQFLQKEKSKRPKLPKRGSPKRKIYGEVGSDVEESEDEKIPAKKQRGNVVTLPSNLPAEEDYEVEKIVDDKMEKNKKFYLVKWKGWPASNNTWQTVASLACPELLTKYEEAKKPETVAKNQKKAATKTTSKSPAPKTPVSARKVTNRREVSPTKKIAKAAVTPKKTAKKSPAKKTPVKTAKSAKAIVESDGEVEEEENQTADQEWEVQEIVDVKVNHGIKEFLIRWKGCDPSQDTWEPEANLECHALIKKFTVKSNDTNSKAPKKKKPRKA